MSIDWDDAVIAPVMDVFGEAVTYRPKDGAPFEITGILTEAYLEVDAVGDAVPMSGQQSRLNVRLSAFMEIEPQPGDTLTVRRTGQTYWVREVRPDGHGGACLRLNGEGRDADARPFSRTGGCDPESGPHHRGPERLFAPRLTDLARRISADSGAHAARAQGIHHARHPQFNTTLWLAVSARVETHSAEAAYADLETLGAQIEAALLTDFNLISQLQHIAFVDTRIEVNAQSKGHLGEVQIDFGLEFYEVFDPVTQSPVQPIATPLEGIDVQHALRPE